MRISANTGIIHAHLAALLFGGTALFAKIITLPASIITFWRTMIALVVLFALCKITGKSMQLARRRDVWIQIGLGAIMGVHWGTYYTSIQLSTVAIGITALFTSPILAVLIESVMRRVLPDWVDLLLSGIVFIGVFCLIPDLEWSNSYTRGIAIGVISACFLALRQVLFTRTQSRTKPGMVLMFYQLIGIGLLYTFFGFKSEQSSVVANWIPLLLLGSFFTAIPHYFNVSALRTLEAKTVLIITSLMLPYGIVLSALFLDEIPSMMTLVGCALVLFAATAENLRASQRKAKT